MMRWFAMGLLIASTAASADPIQGTLQESYECPAGNLCKAVCFSASATPTITVSGYKTLKVWQISSPARMWLDSDGSPGSVMLGVDVSCAFDGTRLAIVPPPPPPPERSDLGPPPQPNTPCFVFPNGQHNPPGCQAGSH